MPIKYYPALDVKEKAFEIIQVLGWDHIQIESLAFLRSLGSISRGTIARCHTLGKAMQMGMGRKKGFYVIEVIAERFDRLSERDKIETIIHELMHIPKTFGGGFVHHDKVNDFTVRKVYEHYCNLKERRLWG